MRIVLKSDSKLSAFVYPPSELIQVGDTYYHCYDYYGDIVLHEDTKPEGKSIYNNGHMYSAYEIFLMEILNKYKLDWLKNTPDPLALLLVCSAVLGNFMRNGKIWTAIIAPFGYGKTFTVNKLRDLVPLKYIKSIIVDNFKTLLYPYKGRRGLLDDVYKGGTIIVPELGTLTSAKRAMQTIRALRQLYDNDIHHITYNTEYHWKGKIGLIVCFDNDSYNIHKIQFSTERYFRYFMNRYNVVEIDEKPIGNILLPIIADIFSYNNRMSIYDIPCKYDNLIGLLSSMVIYSYRSIAKKEYVPHRMKHQLRTIAAALALLLGVSDVNTDIIKLLTYYFTRTNPYPYCDIWKIIVSKRDGISEEELKSMIEPQYYSRVVNYNIRSDILIKENDKIKVDPMIVSLFI